LDYVQTLRDVGVREGEASTEAKGAVQLMTIHRAKGLQFEIVVLADASRRLGGRPQIVYLLPETGLTVKPDGLEDASLTTKLAQWMDKQQSEAEEHRLLYVALTRAREKVLISGHLSETQSGLNAGGWLKEFFEMMEVEVALFTDSRDRWIQHKLPSGSSVGIWISAEGMEQRFPVEGKVEWPESDAKPLYQPLPLVWMDQADLEEQTEPTRDWRATGERVHAPAAAIGRMVHEILRRWVAPQNSSVNDLLENLALREGLVDPGQRRRAVHESRKLLERFWGEPLREKIEKAEERHHELPYTFALPNGGMDIGTIDLLYRDREGWVIIDFKTDELRDDEALESAVEEYRPQLLRYVAAVRKLLGTNCQAYICFLDYEGEVEWTVIQ
jgi:ATP-dependent helicase/nuclease subunit A